MIVLVATIMIVLHTATGTPIEVNPEQITHLRSHEPGGALFTENIRCLVNMVDGKHVAVRETCDVVRQAMEELRK